MFRDIWPSNKENPSVYWHATLSCPLMASGYTTSYLVPISFLSLVLDADHVMDFLSDLAFQACISFYSVFQTKVAPECFCLVRLKMPLLMCSRSVFSRIGVVPVPKKDTSGNPPQPLPSACTAALFSHQGLARGGIGHSLQSSAPPIHTYKTGKSRMHRRADFWSNFQQCAY